MMRSMSERITESLQKKISERLHFYEDLGVRLFYKQRGDLQFQSAATPATETFATPPIQQISYEEAALPKSTRKPELPKRCASRPANCSRSVCSIAARANARCTAGTSGTIAVRIVRQSPGRYAAQDSSPISANARAANSTERATKLFSAMAIPKPNWFSSAKAPATMKTCKASRSWAAQENFSRR